MNTKLIDIETLSIFDIETVGITATFEDLQREHPRLATLWLKRAEFLRERFKDNNAELSDDELWQLKSGLHPEYAKVICVSFGVFVAGKLKVLSFSGHDEHEILTQTNAAFVKSHEQGRILSGANIERFDIPFLWKRMLVNKIHPAASINLWGKKPWEYKMMDIMKFWSGGAWQEGFVSLDTMSALFGIDSPKAEMQASRVHGVYWHDKRIDLVTEYCEKDVIAVSSIVKIISEIS